MPYKDIAKELIILLGFAVIAAFTVNYFSPNGIALILGIYPRSALLILESMLFAFIVALSINLIKGYDFDCGCFSFGERGYGYSALHLLVRDVIYFILGLQSLFFIKHRKWCILQSGSILRNMINTQVDRLKIEG